MTERLCCWAAYVCVCEREMDVSAHIGGEQQSDTEGKCSDMKNRSSESLSWIYLCLHEVTHSAPENVAKKEKMRDNGTAKLHTERKILIVRMPLIVDVAVPALEHLCWACNKRIHYEEN